MDGTSPGGQSDQLVQIENEVTPIDVSDSRRTAEQVEQFRAALEARKSTGNEAEDLTRLLEHQMAHLVPGDDEQVLDTLEVRQTFLMHRFELPLRRYQGRDGFYQGLDTFLNLTSILAGVGASLAASLNVGKAPLILLGLAVGVLQSISQWIKPAQRASQLRSAAADMRQEAWDLLQNQNRYSDADPEKNWLAFCAQINKAEQKQEAQEDQEAAHSGLAGRLQVAAGKLPGGK